mmetsp:Transcript_74446/g.230951  ORF Transcript_74446/g.230951 Transcript_74446/m.230951 type:complete len:207 (+) Transcript_74446:704-1324(+)
MPGHPTPHEPQEPSGPAGARVCGGSRAPCTGGEGAGALAGCAAGGGGRGQCAHGPGRAPPAAARSVPPSARAPARCSHAFAAAHAWPPGQRGPPRRPAQQPRRPLFFAQRGPAPAHCGHAAVGQGGPRCEAGDLARRAREARGRQRPAPGREPREGQADRSPPVKLAQRGGQGGLLAAARAAPVPPQPLATNEVTPDGLRTCDSAQ